VGKQREAFLANSLNSAGELWPVGWDKSEQSFESKKPGTVPLRLLPDL